MSQTNLRKLADSCKPREAHGTRVLKGIENGKHPGGNDKKWPAEDKIQTKNYTKNLKF